jgi:hypothetical protein
MPRILKYPQITEQQKKGVLLMHERIEIAFNLSLGCYVVGRMRLGKMIQVLAKGFRTWKEANTWKKEQYGDEA